MPAEPRQRREPLYNPVQQGCLSVPTPNSSSQNWLVWHQNLVRCFGRQGANALFVDAWDRYGRTNPDAFSTSLAQYLQGQGIDIGESFGQKAQIFGANLVGSVGGFFNAIGYINIAVGAGIAIGFLMLLFNLIYRPEKAAKTLQVVGQGAMLASPQGRVVSAASSAVPKRIGS